MPANKYVFRNKLISGSCKNCFLSDAGFLKLSDTGYLQKFSSFFLVKQILF